MSLLLAAGRVAHMRLRRGSIAFAFDVPTTPHFDSPATTEWFVAQLRRAHRYLEYGSGGSTYLAAQQEIPFISVESDPLYLRCVRRRIAQDGYDNAQRQTYRHADVGRVGLWGYPLTFWPPSPSRLNAFRRYSDPPQGADGEPFLPDLVLVDGRFRVACALKVVRALEHRQDWTVVVDDYARRPEYHVIARHAKLQQCVGRMGVFRGVVDHERPHLDETIRAYETNPD